MPQFQRLFYMLCNILNYPLENQCHHIGGYIILKEVLIYNWVNFCFIGNLNGNSCLNITVYLLWKFPYNITMLMCSVFSIFHIHRLDNPWKIHWFKHEFFLPALLIKMPLKWSLPISTVINCCSRFNCLSIFFIN